MQKFLLLALGLLLAAPSLTARAQSNHSVHSGLALEPAASAQTSPRFTPAPMDVTSPRQPYAFFPQGGTVYDDLYLQNFYDLNADPGAVLDWSGTNFALDGETGEDSLLRSFAEQDKGVPVFAALDGTVSSAVYSDPADHNTVSNANNAPGNYVILDHGAGQQTGYFSLAYADPANPDSRYTPLRVGQLVKAGTQIGLAASSGNSTGPHLHFQSSLNAATYEPFAGPARSGPSWWVSQPSIRRALYLDVFNVDAGNVSAPAPSSDLPRQGTFTLGAVNTGCWTILHNLPAGSAFRLRWLRPDGSVYQSASGSFNFPGSAAFQRTVEYFWNYNWTPGLDQTGIWHLELTINSQLVQTAPFFVLASGAQATNHPPYAVTATLDPAQPTATDAIFCRVATAPGQDGAPVVVEPDSDFVYYHYQWVVTSNGVTRTIREVDSAGHADAIPWGQGNVGDLVQCLVTPVDSHGQPGATATASTTLAGRTAVQLAVGPNNAPRLLWDDPNGLTSLWNIDGAGNHTYRTYGPFTGWTPTALAVGPDNAPRLLWDNGNGTGALWSVDTVGDYGVHLYGPFPGWSAVGLAANPGGQSQILWRKTDGTASLWTVNPDASYSHTEYGPYAGWTAKAIATGPDSVTHLLWTRSDGTIALWNVAPSGDFSYTVYGPFSGWTAVSLAVGGDSKPRLLWDKTNGTISLWTVNLDTSYSHTEYGPYSGWTADSVGVGADNKPRIVWTNVNGQATVWSIDTSGTVTHQEYGL